MWMIETVDGDRFVCIDKQTAIDCIKESVPDPVFKYCVGADETSYEACTRIDVEAEDFHAMITPVEVINASKNLYAWSK